MFNSPSDTPSQLIVELSLEEIPGEIVNLSDTDQIAELFPRWNPKTGQVIALCPVDMAEARKAICVYDPVSGERQEGAIVGLQNPYDYQVPSQGDWMAGLNIDNLAAGGKGLHKLRLVNFYGIASPVLASGDWFDGFRLSEDGDYLTCLEEHGMRLSLIPIPDGTPISVHQTETPGSLSWLGWVP